MSLFHKIFRKKFSKHMGPLLGMILVYNIIKATLQAILIDVIKS